jgi:hypothetical protein
MLYAASGEELNPKLIKKNHTIKPYQIEARDMHTMGTPEGLEIFQNKLQSCPEIIS